MKQVVSDWEFKREVKKWAEEVGVSVKEIHLRAMKKKWASCSSRGRLTFDKCLLEMPIKRRSEVIIHELLHFKYPNHGRMFKALLNIYLHNIDEKNKE